MDILNFKTWIENQVLGGGIQPPMQSPIDPSPAPGQTNAMPDFHLPGSKELPPVKKKKQLKFNRVF